MNKRLILSFGLGLSLGIPIGYYLIRAFLSSSNPKAKSSLTRKTSLSSIPEIEVENESDNNDNPTDILKDKIMKTLVARCDNISGSYKTLDSVLITLRIARILLEKEFISSIHLNKFYDFLNELEKKWILIGKDGFRNIQVIAIEGLGSSGKSTLISGLCSNNNGTLINVSSDINSLKAELSCSKNINSEIILKAIDVVSLYTLAIQAIESNENVIILERYYHSYAVQNICDNIMSDSEINTLDSCALIWPIDLPCPTLVIFLSVSTETRLKRRKISGGTSHTVRSIERSMIRDSRALAIYGLIKYSNIVAVDGSGTPEQVLNNSLALCKEYGINLKYPSISSKEEKRISLGVYGAFDKFI